MGDGISFSVQSLILFEIKIIVNFPFILFVLTEPPLQIFIRISNFFNNLSRKTKIKEEPYNKKSNKGRHHIRMKDIRNRKNQKSLCQNSDFIIPTSIVTQL